MPERSDFVSGVYPAERRVGKSSGERLQHCDSSGVDIAEGHVWMPPKEVSIPVKLVCALTCTVRPSGARRVAGIVCESVQGRGTTARYQVSKPAPLLRSTSGRAAGSSSA